MKRNKTGTMPEISREVYKGVKRMDHQALEGFCKDLYTFGFEDGKAAAEAAAPGVDLEEIYQVIEGTKGIGPARAKLLRDRIGKLFGKEEE